MTESEKHKIIMREQSSPTKRVISRDDADHLRYPNSTKPGVHKDSAPIGGG